MPDPIHLTPSIDLGHGGDGAVRPGDLRGIALRYALDSGHASEGVSLLDQAVRGVMAR